jgi:hypothetical protein
MTEAFRRIRLDQIHQFFSKKSTIDDTALPKAYFSVPLD